MADRSWVDDLDEDWISQPRSSSPIMPHHSPSQAGTVNVQRHPQQQHYTNTNNGTTNRHMRRRSSDTLGSGVSNSYGTTQLHNSRRTADTPEWKRHLMRNFDPSAGGKDLFSPLELESLFRPPTAPRSSSPGLPSKTPPKSPRRSYLQAPHSSGFPSGLSTLAEETGSGSVAGALEPIKQSIPQRQDAGGKPVLRPLNRHSLMSNGLRRTQSSPAAERASERFERFSEGLKGRRKVTGFYSDVNGGGVEHGAAAGTGVGAGAAADRASVASSSHSSRQPSTRSGQGQAGTRWWRSRSRQSQESSDDRRDESISPVSVGAAGFNSNPGFPVLRRGNSNPEPDRSSRRSRNGYYRDREDTAEETHSDTASVGRFMHAEASVYPSSPPIPGQYMLRREYSRERGDRLMEEDEEEDEHPDDQHYIEDGHPDDQHYIEDNHYMEEEEEEDEDTGSSLPAAFIAPRRPPPTPPFPDRRSVLQSSSNSADPDGNGLLSNIRNHRDAPKSKSPVKSMVGVFSHSNSNTAASSGDEVESYFTSKSCRYTPEFRTKTPLDSSEGQRRLDSSEGQRQGNGGSPLKLFSGAYDTYTNEKLRKRLGELEESEDNREELPRANRRISFNGSDGDSMDGRSDRDFSGGSMVVNRLEKMARQTEKRESPPPGTEYVRRHSKTVRYGAATKDEQLTATTTTTTSTKIVNGRDRNRTRHHRHQRQLSALPASSSDRPSQSPTSGRKHRRWRSDESSAANDGVAGPISPVKERTPKRLRRDSVIVPPRPGSSGTPKHYFQSPAASRRRIYAGIEEGSILASSRRKQRSRANSKESQVSAKRAVHPVAVPSGTSPSPTPRKKKHHILKNTRELGIAPSTAAPLNGQNGHPRKIIFSGSKGDGMQGESFEMPTPPRDAHLGARRDSITTKDFLEQAEAVMARLRGLGLSNDNNESGECDGGPQSTRKGINELNADTGIRDRRISNGDDSRGGEGDRSTVSTSMRLHAVAIKLNNNRCGDQGAYPSIHAAPPVERERERERQDGDFGFSRSSKSSRTSVRVISNVPEVLAHRLATKTAIANDMTFDKVAHAWVSRTPIKEGEEDPLRDISDLTVDSKEEERALNLAKAHLRLFGCTPDGEKSGVWRSSRAMDDTELREMRAGGDSCAVGGTWDESHWGRSQPLSSSVGSNSSQRSNESGFGANIVRTETRTTSYGTDENIEDDKKKTETTQHDHDSNDKDEGEEPNDKDGTDAQKSSARFADDAFASSPLKREMRMDDVNDDDVDGFLEHGSLRRSGRNNPSVGSYRNTSRRKSLGKTFIGRPISRITEEEEEVALKFRRPVMERPMEREFRRSFSSALTPIRSPYESQLATAPPSVKNKGDVSYYMSPLPDLSYRFETTEALVTLELSYITSRRGPKATSKAVEASFSIAQANLVKHLTDVEPYDPYWDFIKCLKLSDRKLETLHTLNEWCPRISELDVSNNDLGQLSGAPDSVLTLNAQQNCLSNVTFFGHLLNLQYLDVCGNGLENLEALRACIHLREIKADDNQLTSISGVSSIAGLMSLRCRRNRLERVDLSKSELTRLAELDLRANRIVEIKGLEALPSLIHLNLDQNCLATLSLPSGIKLNTIRSIKLTQNSFTSFDVGPFPNVRILYMDNNKLSHVSGLTRAKSIDAVSFRDQATISGTFDLDVARMFESRKLYLSSNPVAALNLKASFLNLQLLEMAGCHLRALPKNIASLIPNVRVLNLNYNAIPDIRPLAGLTRLVKLSCAGNRISNVKKLGQALERCRGIKWVDFRNNPVTVGFYPPITTVTKPAAEDYAKDPFEIVEAEEEKDAAHVARLDLDTRCERKRYWLVVAAACRKLRGFDGLLFVREDVEVEDDVWKECVKRGWLVVGDAVEKEVHE